MVRLAVVLVLLLGCAAGPKYTLNEGPMRLKGHMPLSFFTDKTVNANMTIEGRVPMEYLDGTYGVCVKTVVDTYEAWPSCVERLSTRRFSTPFKFTTKWWMAAKGWTRPGFGDYTETHTYETHMADLDMEAEDNSVRSHITIELWKTEIVGTEFRPVERLSRWKRRVNIECMKCMPPMRRR
jgi:hypothetical protein